MKKIMQKISQRLFVLVVLLCAFSVIYLIGCAGVVKTVIVDDWAYDEKR